MGKIRDRIKNVAADGLWWTATIAAITICCVVSIYVWKFIMFLVMTIS